MASNKIDEIDFHYVHVAIPVPGNELRDITPDNASDGHVKLKLGKRAPEGSIVTFRDFDSVAAADTHLTNCYALKGGIVTVYDCFERSIEDIAILDVVPMGRNANGQPSDIVRADVAVGGETNGVYIVELFWRVQRVSSAGGE